MQMEAIGGRKEKQHNRLIYDDALSAAVQNFVGMAMADALVTLGRQRLVLALSEVESSMEATPPPQINTLENEKDNTTTHKDELSFLPWIALFAVQRVGRGGLAREQSRKSFSSLRLRSHNREEKALQSNKHASDGGTEAAACVITSSSSASTTGIAQVNGGETEEGHKVQASSSFSISAPEEHVYDEKRGGGTRRSVGVETADRREDREEADDDSSEVAAKVSVSECAVQTSPIMRPVAVADASSSRMCMTSSSHLMHAEAEGNGAIDLSSNPPTAEGSELRASRMRLPQHAKTAAHERSVHVQAQGKSKSGGARDSQPPPSSKGLLDACGVHLAGSPQSPKRLLGRVRQARTVSKSSTNSWTFPDSPYRVPVVGDSQKAHTSPQKRKERANLTSAAAGQSRTSSSKSLHFSAKSALALRNGGGGNGTSLKKSELNKAQTGPQGEAEKIQHCCHLEAEGRDFLYRLQRSENDKLYYSSAREKLRIESDAANVEFEAYFRERRTHGLRSSPQRKRL